jgi:hypothetical protein
VARQRILDDQSRRFEWVITGAALWWRPADWAVRAEQIRAVAVAAARRNVDPARFALTMMPRGCCCLIGVGLPVGLSCGPCVREGSVSGSCRGPNDLP